MMRKNRDAIGPEGNSSYVGTMVRIVEKIMNQRWLVMLHFCILSSLFFVHIVRADFVIESLRNVTHYSFAGSGGADVFVLNESRGFVDFSESTAVGTRQVFFTKLDTVTSEKNLMLVNCQKDFVIPTTNVVEVGFDPNLPQAVLSSYASAGLGGVEGSMVVVFQAPAFNIEGSLAVYGSSSTLLTHGGLTEDLALNASDDAMLFVLGQAEAVGEVSRLSLKRSDNFYLGRYGGTSKKDQSFISLNAANLLNPLPPPVPVEPPAMEEDLNEIDIHQEEEEEDGDLDDGELVNPMDGDIQEVEEVEEEEAVVENLEGASEEPAHPVEEDRMPDFEVETLDFFDELEGLGEEENEVLQNLIKDSRKKVERRNDIVVKVEETNTR